MESSKLLAKIRLHDKVPRHVAIIMDGNGRWAESRNLPRTAGHRAGMEAVTEVIEGSIEAGVEVLTLFAFSTENWQRPSIEIDALMGLLRLYINKEKVRLRNMGVEVYILGDLTKVNSITRKAIKDIASVTTGGDTLRLNLMISYSGRNDLLEACRSFAEEVSKGEMVPAELSEEILSERLYTAGIPDPDLLIRTSGEFRVSNFMLWQIAYTELSIVFTLWPDFSREDLFDAICDYHLRDRRFGRIVGQEISG
ncbi:MAG TPA: di-trans,poly-cis-decaprenylcistransferase [Gemmatimonadetes bacterium]|nr:di-trans,poly-cis-decaprenylcistransferase [Gemmatimonadota bacterium]